MADRRVVIAERERGCFRVVSSHPIRPGDTVAIGRESPTLLGADPPDPQVSRLAVTVTCLLRGWTVEATNRNGTLVHPWGLPAWQTRTVEALTDARVALRVLGDAAREHWVLLEDDSGGEDTGALSTRTIETAATVRAQVVRPLTPAQLQAVALVFADLVAWPPVASGSPRQLKQVARALGLSVSAVQERLKAVVAKAVSLGLSREVDVTDPEYVYVLVRAGYLRPALVAGVSD